MKGALQLAGLVPRFVERIPVELLLPESFLAAASRPAELVLPRGLILPVEHFLVPEQALPEWSSPPEVRFPLRLVFRLHESHPRHRSPLGPVSLARRIRYQ